MLNRVCGTEKVWTPLNREGIQIATCTVVQLMEDLVLVSLKMRQT